MQYRSKRFVSLLLVVFMVVSMFPGTALASESETLILGDGLVLGDNVTIITDSDPEPAAEEPAAEEPAAEEPVAEEPAAEEPAAEEPAAEEPAAEEPAPALETGEEIAAYDGAEEPTTLTLDAFIAKVKEGNGTYDGNGVTVAWTNDATAENYHNYDNVNNTYTGQYYDLFGDFGSSTSVSTEYPNLAISNVNFVFTPSGTITTAEFQLYSSGTISFTNCTFEKVTVDPWGLGESYPKSATFTGCNFNNITNRYAIHQSRAKNLTVTACAFNNCERGIHVNAPEIETLTITNNSFTGIGASYGVLCLAENGNIGAATLTITGNTATDQVMLRQLNTTTTYAQVSAILDASSNTYGTAYVNATNVIIPTAPAVNYVAKIGDTEYATFAEALAAASAMTGDVTVEINDKVTLSSNLSGSYDSIKFVGKDTDAEIYLEVEGYITATGKKVAFEDLTLSKSVGSFITNAGFMNVAFGVYDVTEVTYTNCTFANGAYASSGTVTFTKCTFYRSHDKYGLWAYGNVDVTVDGCTFADYRGIKMYAEGAAKTVDLTVKNTDFSAVTDKPAIVLTYGESVTLEGNTYSSTGVFELDLDGAPNGTSVTSDVAPTCINDNGACGVLVDSKIYTTVAAAAAVAKAGDTVTLLHNSAETVELAEGVILNTNGYTAENVTVAVAAVATVTDSEGTVTNHEDLQTALKALTAGATLTLLQNVTITEAWDERYTGARISADNITIDGDGHTINFACDIADGGNYHAAFRLENNVATIKNLTIDMSAATNSKSSTRIRAISSKAGDLTVDNCTFIGNTDCTNARAIIFGEGAPDSPDTYIKITNSTFTNWRKGVTDNENAKDMGTVEITGNTFTNAGVGVSASTSVTFTGNTVIGGAVSITSYSSDTLAVTATGNSLDANYVNIIDKAAAVDAQDDFIVNPVAQIGSTKYETLAMAVAAAEDGDTVVLLSDTAGSGVIIEKNLTIDFGGHTYTVTGPAVGSEGTTTLGFQLLAGSDHANPYDVTLTNGTIASTEYDESGVLVLVMNYSDLTLNNITLDGKYAESATLVCNNGTSQVIGETNITGATDTAYTLDVDGYSFDYYPSVSLTINTTGTITGESYFYGDKAAVEILAGTFTGTINTYDGTYGTADITITGGTFANDVSAYCTETGTSLPTLDDRFVVGEAPTATVNDLGSMTIPESDYIVYGGSKDGDMPLSFVMQFLADQDEEDMETSPYADWYADFVITFTGIEEGTFTADGCYLAGYYGEFGWVKVPVDGMTIEEGARYPVMLGVGMGQKYEYICSGVKDFRCAMYLPDEILEANPNLQVTLELSVVDNSQGEDAATAALVNAENIYQVTDYDYEVEDFCVASISTTRTTYYYTTLQKAFDEAYPGETIDLLTDISLTDTVVVDQYKNLTLNLNGCNITHTSDSNQPAFRVKGTLKVIGDGSVSSDTGYSFIVGSNSDEGLISGDLTIKSGSFFGVTSAVSVTAGVATIEGGYFEATPYDGAYDFTLNCIDANYDSGAAKIVVTGGSFYQFDPSDNLAETGGANFCDPNYTGYYDAESQCWTVDWLHPVAVIGETPYESLEEAIAAAEENNTVILMDNVTIDEMIKLETPITLDLNGWTVTSTAKKAFEVYADVTIQNGWIEAAQRCVDTRTKVNLTLTDMNLTATSLTYGNSQPLTIGGYDHGTVVNLNNCQIDAGDYGYGIISFVKTDLTVTDSNIEGFAAIYMKKDGTSGSTINLINSYLCTRDDASDGDTFAAVVFEDSNITLTVDENTQIAGDMSTALALCTAFNPNATGHVVTIAGDLTGTYALSGWTAGSTVKVIDNGDNVNYLESEGYVIDETGLIIGTAVVAIWRDPEPEFFVSLQKAVDAANEGEILTLLEDIKLTETINVAADDKLTIDLSGYVIDGLENCNIAIMSYGDLTIMDSSQEQTGAIKAGKTSGKSGNAVNICGGSFTLESGSIYSVNNAILIDEEAATININGGSITAEPTTSNSAVMYISSTSDTVVNIQGGEMVGYNGILLWNNTAIEMTGGSIDAQGSLGIQGNGSKDNTEIHIGGEASISGYYAAIYHPQGGVLTISDNATLTGWTGVVVKGGDVTISGGTISGTGAADSYQPVSSGFVDTGDALYVEHYDSSTSSDRYGTPTVTVTGGTFLSTHAKSVASYVNTNNDVEALTAFISGGEFSDIPAEDLVADGFTPATEKNENGLYGIVEEEIMTTGEAAIGSTVYTTLAEAIEVANASTTPLNINILTAISEKPEVTIANAMTFINGSGYTLWEDDAKTALDGIVADSYTVTDVAGMGMIFSIALAPEEAEPVATINGVEYTTVKAALEASQNGDTVVLVADANEENSDMIIPKGVTLDLQAFDLKVRSLNGANGSYVTGTLYSGANGSHARLNADTLILGEAPYVDSLNYNVLPIWDSTENTYIFSRYIINTTADKTGLRIDEENGKLQFQFVQNMSGAVRKAFLLDGSSDNKMDVCLTLSWMQDTAGLVELTFTYSDIFVGNVAKDAAGTTHYRFTMSDYVAQGVDLDTLQVQAYIRTDSGVLSLGDIFELEDATFTTIEQ